MPAGRTFVSNVETITIENVLDLDLTVPQYGWTDRASLIELSGYGTYPSPGRSPTSREV